MKLSIMERIMLLGALPQKGNLLTLKIIGDLQDNLNFSEEEIKKFEMKNEANGNITWNIIKEHSEDMPNIPVGEKATDIVVEALKGLDSSSKMTKNHISLYEKFIK